MSLGVDVGGTFTDLAHWDGSTLRVGKTSSTPEQSEGVVAGALELLEGSSVASFLHGTTVATNALLERRGARTALVTDEGLADIVAIGRQDRPSLYDSFEDRAEPIVPADLRFTVPARSSAPDDLAGLLERIAEGGAEAVAVSLLYAFLDPSREEAIADALAPLGVPVSRSSVVANEFREFERGSTTTLNAFLTPEMSRYLERLADRTRAAGLPDDVLVMRSSGGLMSLAGASALPVAALLSGPAGGVVATAALGTALGDDRLISFDMGGTSTDVCRIEGGVPEQSFERWIGGLPVRTPSVAVHTVGAGGGSIGWADPGGALRVGPRSAGAFPGPASYGRGGTEAAVTDANLALGRIPADARLAGSVPLDRDAALGALERLGGQVGLGPLETAEGVVEVVEAHMERAVRTVSVEEGADPRPARLVAFGGAGGLHAVALARRLEMRGVVVPPFAGVFSAVGLLLAPPRHDAAASVHLDPADEAALDRAVGAVAGEAELGLRGMGVRPETTVTSVDVRYRGQAHETSVPYDVGTGWAALARDFHRRHEARNGFARPDDPIEVVTVRASAVGRPAMQWSDLPEVRPDGNAGAGTIEVHLDGVTQEVRRIRRAGLGAGDAIDGPAVVVEGEATTLLAPGDRAIVHESGALEVSW